MSFVPLHVISGYSLLKSGLTVKAIAEAVNKSNFLGVGISDIGNLSCVPPLAKELDRYNKKLVVGMSVDINGDNISLYAKNEDGYRNIIKISSLYQSGQEDKIIDFLKVNHNGVIGIIETIRGTFYTKFIEIRTTHEFESYVFNISNLFEEFYLGLEATNENERVFLNEIRNFASSHSYETLAFPRIRYLKKSDAIVIDILSAIDNNSELDIKAKDGYEYFMLEKHYLAIYGKKDCDKTIELLNKIDFSIHKKRGGLLHYEVNDSNTYLKDLAYQGLKRLGKENNQDYITRLNEELSVISSLHYEDYFLIVQDYVNYAKTHDILVGPGRGSAAGSLVSYALNITEVDPIKNGLLFERFLNPARQSMPDIDVDFMDIKRNDVIEYIKKRYASDKVAVITTFQTIKAKQSIRDIGRVYGYSKEHIDLLCKSLNEDKLSLADAYRNIPSFKKLIDDGPYFLQIISLASKIEGLPRQRSNHPSGIIINNNKLSESIPVYIDEITGGYLTQYEDKYLEEQGFLKMDILALGNLTTIYECVKSINEHENIKLDPFHIPFDTPKTYELIASGKTAGIFQLESKGMNRAIKILHPTCYEDIVKLLALYRPGPMEDLSTYVERKNGKPYKIEDERLINILEPTKGVIMYQEQLSQIAIAIAGFSKEEADVFRAAVSKKKKEVFKLQEEKFINGAINRGASKEFATSLFKKISRFEDYGFNKSHACSYAVISSITAYLKMKYPLDFYKALLLTRTSINDSKFANYLSELTSFGYKILPPDINHSTSEFQIDDKGLLFPLSSIKNISDLLVNNILIEREAEGEFKSYFDFVARMYGYKITPSNVERLIDSGALDCFNKSRRTLLMSIPTAFQHADLINGTKGQLLDNSLIPEPLLPDLSDDPKEKLEREFDAIYMMLSSNPLEYKREELTKLGISKIIDADIYDTHVAGIIKNIKIIRTRKSHSQMAYLTIFDESGEIEVIVFNELFNQVSSLLEKNNMIIVHGHLRTDRDNEDNYSLIPDKIESLEK